MRCLIGGQAEAAQVAVSDRVGQFGECGGDPQVPDGFDSEFVMAAAETSHAVSVSSGGG